MRPPFSVNVLDSVKSEDLSTTQPLLPRGEDTNSSITMIPLFPASYRTRENDIAIAKPGDLEYLRSELSVDRLNEIHEWLMIVGRPMPPRPLHVQRIKLREICPTEQMDLHLAWSPKRIYIKPTPRFLLHAGFWEAHLCVNSQLYECAMGFLLSYAALIQHESDFWIAKDAHLLPEEVTWPRWVLLVRELLNCRNLTNVNKRYIYGELRLGRINMIYRFRKGRYRGYLSSCTTYGDFFRDNINSLITLFAYTTIVLSAMQVALGTSYSQNNDGFERASYGFAVFSIIAPLVSVTAMLAILLGLVLSNLVATLRYRQRRLATIEGAPMTDATQKTG